MKEVLEKQAVSPMGQLVFCPMRYRDVPVERCLQCSRLVRTDDNDPPRYVVCDVRMLDRRETFDAGRSETGHAARANASICLLGA
jgi:hypothetical protein